MSDEIKCLGDVTQDNILSEDAFIWAFDEDDNFYREQNIMALEDLAAKFNLKTKFNKLLSAFKKEWDRGKYAEARKTGNIIASANQTKFNSKYKELQCGDWVADQNGIAKMGSGKYDIVIYQPVTIVNQFINVDTGEEKTKLAFKKNGRWKEITPNKNVIATSSKIVQLSNAGLPVTSENAKFMVKYLADLEGLNPYDIPVERSTTKLGWSTCDNKMLFAPYDTELKFDGESQFADIFNSIKEKGSRDEWLLMARFIRLSKRIEPRIMLAASFASALVKICETLPFFVHVHGPSEGGKTLCLMLAASVWGNPDTHGNLFGNFSTTATAIEARANVLNNLPLIVDDTAKVSKRLLNDFSELIYTLCSGTGKDRSNQELGLRKVNNWHNVILTSGEHPIVDGKDQAGAINRVIEVTADYERMFDDGRAVAECLKKNYGFAGKEFVDEVKLMLANDEHSIRKIQKEFLDQINKTEKMQKQAISMSVILTADKIISESLFQDGMALTVEEVTDFIKSENEVDENKRCFEYVKSEILRNIGKFIQPKDEYTPPEIYGRFATNMQGENRVYIITSVFDEICKRGNFNANSFKKWAKTKNISICSGDRTTDVQQINEDGKTMRVINLPWDDVEM
jgi:uncharacterized protein (DUF927 family)